MGDRPISLKTSAPYSFMTTYQMNIISSRSISLDSALNILWISIFQMTSFSPARQNFVNIQTIITREVSPTAPFPLSPEAMTERSTVYVYSTVHPVAPVENKGENFRLTYQRGAREGIQWEERPRECTSTWPSAFSVRLVKENLAWVGGISSCSPTLWTYFLSFSAITGGTTILSTQVFFLCCRNITVATFIFGHILKF